MIDRQNKTTIKLTLTTLANDAIFCSLITIFYGNIAAGYHYSLNALNMPPSPSPNSLPAALFSIWNTSLNCSSWAADDDAAGAGPPCAAAAVCCVLPSAAAGAPPAPAPALHAAACDAACCCCVWGHDAACELVYADVAARPEVPAPSCVYEAAANNNASCKLCQLGIFSCV